MLYFKLNENSVQARAFAEYLKTLSFVEILESEKVKTKSFEKSSEEEFYEDFEEAMTDVKKMQQGKEKKKNLNDLLDEL